MGLLGACWGLLGSLGASWGPLGASWGLLGSLGASWGPLGASWGPLLEPSWGPLRPSWRPLGLSWGPLGLFGGRLGRLLGRLGAILGASWAVLERREAKIARTPKTFKNQWKSNDFCLLGPSWEASWRPLGASWRPLGPSGGHLGRLRAIFRRLWALFDRLDGPPRRPWPVLGPSWARGPSRRPTRKTPEAPGRAQKRPGIWGCGPLRNYNSGPLGAA